MENNSAVHDKREASEYKRKNGLSTFNPGRVNVQTATVFWFILTAPITNFITKWIHFVCNSSFIKETSGYSWSWIFLFPIFQDGEDIIKDFLGQVANLPVETMTEEQTACEVSKLKEQVLARNNPYIQELLAK